jgi:fibronectin type 3 domain-containing protein
MDQMKMNALETNLTGSLATPWRALGTGFCTVAVCLGCLAPAYGGISAVTPSEGTVAPLASGGYPVGTEYTFSAHTENNATAVNYHGTLWLFCSGALHPNSIECFHYVPGGTTKWVDYTWAPLPGGETFAQLAPLVEEPLAFGADEVLWLFHTGKDGQPYYKKYNATAFAWDSSWKHVSNVASTENSYEVAPVYNPVTHRVAVYYNFDNYLWWVYSDDLGAHWAMPQPVPVGAALGAPSAVYCPYTNSVTKQPFDTLLAVRAASPTNGALCVALYHISSGYAEREFAWSIASGSRPFVMDLRTRYYAVLWKASDTGYSMINWMDKVTGRWLVPCVARDHDTIWSPSGAIDDIGTFWLFWGKKDPVQKRWVMTSISREPPAPANLVAVAVSGNQINLSWSPIGPFTRYNVKRATVSGGPYITVATNVPTTFYSDIGLSSGTAYFYVVSFSTAAGESANSAQASATTLAPPLPPSRCVANAAYAVVQLTWTASPGATSYNVKRAAADGGPYATIWTGSAGSYTDTNVINGTPYYYVISALSAGGESANSPQATATPQAVAPAAPTGLAGTFGPMQAQLSWNPSLGATSYNLKRATLSGGPYLTITNVTATSVTDTGLTNGTPYYYVVSALNPAGESPDSAPVSVTPNDLFGYWKFDETKGPSYDSGAGGNNANWTISVSWTSGILSNAVRLDGTYAYLWLPNGLVRTLNDFSIATWVKVDTNRSGSRIFDFGSGSNVDMFLTPAIAGKALQFAITTNGSTGEQQINTRSVLSTGIWHHVAVTLSGTTGLLYLDGVAVGTNTSLSLKPSNLGITTKNYFGWSQSPTGPSLQGALDDFRLYNRALSAAEVSSFAAVALPSPWAQVDIAALAATGAATLINGTWTIQGAGNIGGTADAGHFVYQTADGDCFIKARIATLEDTGPHAKVGLMIRETLAANAREAGVWVTPTNIVYTCRTTTGGATTTTSGPGWRAPCWIGLSRIGNHLIFSYSPNGVDWLSSAGTDVSMTTNTYFGVGAESGVSGVLVNATLDNVVPSP